MNKVTIRKRIDDWFTPNTHEGYDSFAKTLSAAGYYCITVSLKNKHQAFLWLEDNVGYNNYNWVGQHFWFNHEKDAMHFALKWL